MLHNNILKLTSLLLFTFTFNKVLGDDAVTTTPANNNNNNNNNPQTTSDDNVVRLTLARQTTTPEAITNTLTQTTTSRIPTSQTAENSADEEVFKILLTMPSDDNYYNGMFGFGGNGNGNNGVQQIELRLDLIQPDVWVMNNASFYDCSYLSEWWDSEASYYGITLVTNSEGEESTEIDLPASITTMEQYTASNCARNGRYAETIPVDQQPQPTDDVFHNGDTRIIPYINLINAMGQINTNNFSFNITNGNLVRIDKFTFVNVNDTNMYVGGLGLAGNPSNSGFLYSLVDQGIIRSPGYSLWFNNQSDWQNALGQLIPGVVNKKYYNGDLVAYDMVQQQGTRYPPDLAGTDSELNELNLPIVLILDLVVENESTGQTMSMKSSDDPLPVLLDSRSFYTYLPLDIIINLAIQMNAYYSSEADRWLVECDVILNSTADLNFQFGGGLQVRIPLTEFITTAVYEGKTLNFEDGQQACFLAMSPTSKTGYNSLGLPFIRRIYLVVDNEGQKIAMANSNNYLQVDRQDLAPEVTRVTTLNQTAVSISLATASSTRTGGSNSSTSMTGSIAQIAFKQIPFATTYSQNSSDSSVIFSFTSVYANSDDGAENLDRIPARLSGAMIRSGSIYLTGVGGGLLTTTTTIPGRGATAASANPSLTRNIGVGSAGEIGGMMRGVFEKDIRIVMGIIGGIVLVVLM